MNALTNKAITVILSCNTTDQLRVAANFAALAYKKLSNDRLATMQDITLIERSIGFTQAKIKYTQVMK